MAEQRDCSCGGSNENCARCGGNGFIWTGQNRKNARPELPQVVVPPNRRKVPLQMASPRPAIPTRERSEPKRTSPSQTKSFTDPPRKSPLRPSIAGVNRPQDGPAEKAERPTRVCPLCSATVRADRLDAHVRARCLKRTNKEKKRAPIVLGHGYSQKPRRPRRGGKAFPLADFDGQPRFEGGFRITQGGLPGSGRH
jgi:hypothetical protein